MQVDPYNEEYGEVVDLSDTIEEMRKALEEFDNDKVMATSSSKAALRKLQDDLRKAGYRKAK